MGIFEDLQTLNNHRTSNTQQSSNVKHVVSIHADSIMRVEPICFAHESVEDLVDAHSTGLIVIQKHQEMQYDLPFSKILEENPVFQPRKLALDHPHTPF